MGFLQAFWYNFGIIYAQKHRAPPLRVTGESCIVHGESLVPLTPGSVLIRGWFLRVVFLEKHDVEVKILDGNGFISQHIKK